MTQAYRMLRVAPSDAGKRHYQCENRTPAADTPQEGLR